MSGDTNISTVWLRRDGHWQMHLHQTVTILDQSMALKGRH